MAGYLWPGRPTSTGHGATSWSHYLTPASPCLFVSFINFCSMLSFLFTSCFVICSHLFYFFSSNISLFLYSSINLLDLYILFSQSSSVFSSQLLFPILRLIYFFLFNFFIFFVFFHGSPLCVCFHRLLLLFYQLLFHSLHLLSLSPWCLFQSSHFLLSRFLKLISNSAFFFSSRHLSYYTHFSLYLSSIYILLISSSYLSLFLNFSFILSPSSIFFPKLNSTSFIFSILLAFDLFFFNVYSISFIFVYFTLPTLFHPIHLILF